MALNKAQLWQNWDCQFRQKIRGILGSNSETSIKKDGKICSIKFNLKKKKLNRQLVDISNYKKEFSELGTREKYQATTNDPTLPLYKMMDETRKRKKKQKKVLQDNISSWH